MIHAPVNGARIPSPAGSACVKKYSRWSKNEPRRVLRLQRVEAVVQVVPDPRQHAEHRERNREQGARPQRTPVVDQQPECGRRDEVHDVRRRPPAHARQQAGCAPVRPAVPALHRAHRAQHRPDAEEQRRHVEDQRLGADPHRERATARTRARRRRLGTVGGTGSRRARGTPPHPPTSPRTGARGRSGSCRAT